MKKLLSVIVIILCLFTLTACGNKNVLSDKQMTSKLEKLGFSVNDITHVMEDSNITAVKTANNKKYQIEYYVFKTDDIAKTAYKNNSLMFKENKKYKGKEKTGNNYNEYIQETNDYYNKIVRVDNILVYVSVNVDYKKNVNKVLNKLGF